MLKADCLFKTLILAVLIGAFSAPVNAGAQETVKFKRHDTVLYQEVFDQAIYDEATSYLHLDRLYRRIFGKKVRAGNVNRYDEVADSSFFTNRHARKKLSLQELETGYSESTRMDTSGKLTVTQGKFVGLHPGFFVRDSRGDLYLLKFDPIDNLELATSAEVITSRFYYALGYNVPQYTIETISLDQLETAPGATAYDDTGFKKTLTKQRLEEYMLFIPQDADGNYRASASKILEGEVVGYFSFDERRRDNPEDKVKHQHLREIRALKVFASWLNNYDQREGNTLDVLSDENGHQTLKHYLIDFNGSLGSGTEEAKPPMFSHEHMLDYGEAFKAFLSLGLWEKPWQKRWRETGEEVTQSPAVGYFDNRYFHPEKFKTQLPYYSKKNLTRADAFWAAKIIMTFSDDEIKAMVKAGEYTNAEDAEEITRILIERRDIIGKYWFSQASPLDAFDLKGHQMVFKDLAVEHGFESAAGTEYEAKVVGKNGKRGRKITTLVSGSASFDLDPAWLTEYDRVDLWIRTMRAEHAEKSPYVLVSVTGEGVLTIIHED